MAQINKPTDYFNTVLYTGTGASNSITGVGFQPDWVWLKRRDNVGRNRLFDAVRGATKSIRSDGTEVELTRADSLTSFDSDGFTLGADSTSGGINVNISGETMVGWSWLGANGTASNTDGSITSQVSANTDSGFSIVSFTSNASGDDTVGHGLGVAPEVIFAKARNGDSFNWGVYHSAVTGINQFLRLNTSDSIVTSGSNVWGSSLPSSSTIGITSGNSVEASKDCIAYCFAEKKGFSKFGSYTGNGSTDGPFIYTGFKPSFIMWKSSSASSGNWGIIDNKRAGYNSDNDQLYANLSNAENNGASFPIDILSNGFKNRYSSTNTTNASGVTYIYMAFAENPLVGTNDIPTTAR